eukprot:g26382.t1
MEQRQRSQSARRPVSKQARENLSRAANAANGAGLPPANSMAAFLSDSIFEDAVELGTDSFSGLQRKLLQMEDQHKAQLAAQRKEMLKTLTAQDLKHKEEMKAMADSIRLLSTELSKLTIKHQEEAEKLKEVQKKLKATEDKNQAFEKKVRKDLANKVGLKDTFVIRSLNSTAVMAHQRFWKGEKMVIDRFEDPEASDPEDWR